MVLQDLLLFPHFWGMLTVEILLGLSVAMVLLHKPKSWRKLHMIFTGLAIILVIIGVILVGLNLAIPHGIFGLITLILLAGAGIGGIVAIKKAKNKKQIRNAHIWLGRIIFILATISLLFGILNFL